MIALVDLALRQSAFRLDDIALHVPARGYGVLMGGTGSGKTSLIECICGLRPVHAGAIIVGERDVTQLPPAARGIGYVPQDAALFPTMTVAEQLGFALAVRHHPADAIAARVNELAARLGITHLLGRSITGLSGGERQRIALGRALAARPAVLLLDEPLASVDEAMQDALHDLLAEIHRSEAVTVLHVTHSSREAQRLATHRFRLRDGAVVAE